MHDGASRAASRSAPATPAALRRLSATRQHRCVSLGLTLLACGVLALIVGAGVVALTLSLQREVPQPQRRLPAASLGCGAALIVVSVVLVTAGWLD